MIESKEAIEILNKEIAVLKNHDEAFQTAFELIGEAEFKFSELRKKLSIYGVLIFNKGEYTRKRIMEIMWFERKVPDFAFNLICEPRVSLQYTDALAQKRFELTFRFNFYPLGSAEFNADFLNSAQILPYIALQLVYAKRMASCVSAILAVVSVRLYIDYPKRAKLLSLELDVPGIPNPLWRVPNSQ